MTAKDKVLIYDAETSKVVATISVEEYHRLLAENERLKYAEQAHERCFKVARSRQAYINELHTSYEDMTSIALWATRRLANQQHKDFAYDAIEKNLGTEVERV
ncbi:hypothetical protein [Sporosarcina sp. ITBMC105]